MICIIHFSSVDTFVTYIIQIGEYIFNNDVQKNM